MKNKTFLLTIIQHHSSKWRSLLYTLTIASVFILSSCEKVIDIDLEEGSKKYVIEGTVTNVAGSPHEVKISQTKKFEDNNNFVGISGATVTIQVNNSTSYTLSEASNGIYQTTAFTGVPGNTYKLSITVNGNNFTAESTMPSKIVTLDTLTVSDLAFGGNSFKTIAPAYIDPVGLGNSYRFIQYANGVQVKRIFVQNDELSDGLKITRPMVNPDSELKNGDIIKVEMQCIDTNIYTYWYSLDQASTGNSSATPANPVTNISGGALGYFSAHTVTSKTVSIP
jgi:hypothetical protein